MVIATSQNSGPAEHEKHQDTLVNFQKPMNARDSDIEKHSETSNIIAKKIKKTGQITA